MTFVYTPLDHDKHEIRLLKIDPCGDGRESLIRLRLMTADLSMGPQYTALSYTWGDEHPRFDIAIVESASGKTGTFQVRSNLHAFLKHARETAAAHADRTLFWIDQICINQADGAEKTHQVHRMSDIYRQAVEVQVWLDAGVPERVHLGALFQEGWPSIVRRKDEEGIHLQLLVSKDFGDDVDEQSTERITFCDLIDTPSGEQVYEAVNRLLLQFVAEIDAVLTSRYWTRLWIIQELCLAGSCFVWIGGYKIDWTNFSLQMVRISKRDIGLSSAARDKGLLSIGTFMGRLKPSSLNEGCTWTFATVLSDQFQCHLPIDNIHGLLAIVHPAVRVVPDYRKSSKDVVFDIMRREVAHQQDRGGVSQYGDIVTFVGITLQWWKSVHQTDTIQHAELLAFLKIEIVGTCRDHLEKSGIWTPPAFIDDTMLWAYVPKQDSALWRRTMGRIWGGGDYREWGVRK